MNVIAILEAQADNYRRNFRISGMELHLIVAEELERTIAKLKAEQP